MTASHLTQILSRLSARAASSVVARGRIASPALNAALLRRLSAHPGAEDALLAEPVFEAARAWESADYSLDDLSGGLLHSELVKALDEAKSERMGRGIRPWSHQLTAWEAARDGFSCLVSSGTGSGKTECFMVPMLDDLLRDPAKGLLSGVRAIAIYPLNALIESQRERLAAWTAPLKDRLKFAMYNGLTPENRRKEDRGRTAAAELGNRAAIRETPPAILVTNVTMLEYLLLRAKDRPILERSQGLLRWIVLDEAHGYIGAQAAEMALLLRRVRAAFGVEPAQVRLMATSATIGEGDRTVAKLKRFTSDLAGVDENRVHVIQGRTVDPKLPKAGADTPLDPERLGSMDPVALWELLAPHPRVQKLQTEMSEGGASLSDVAKILFDETDDYRRDDTQAVLDAAARARRSETEAQLLPWRAHIFHRAQGGFWVCVDPSCANQDPELAAEDSGWRFGAVWLKQRDRCECAAPVFELFACNECGTPYLLTGVESGAMARLVPLHAIQTDDFAVDAEPDPEAEVDTAVAHSRAILSPGRDNVSDRFLNLEDGRVYDNTPPTDARWARVTLDENEDELTCCPHAKSARLEHQRYNPPFFMGVAMPTLVNDLAQPFPEPGRPMGGRRALTFSDSRQGTARLAAKLQQDAERNLTRAFLYHAVQEDRGLEGEERKKNERKLEIFKAWNDPAFTEEIQDIERNLSGETKPISWSDLVDRFAQQNELREYATEVWRERAGGGRDLADDPTKLAEMFLYRELLRRPRIQNNAETMGLARLSFPMLEKRARENLPRALAEAGVETEGWIGLALAAVDFVFREHLAIWLTRDWMMRFVSPRSGRQRYSVCRAGLAPSDRPAGSRPWPVPVPQPGRPSRLHRLVYALIGGDWENIADRDRADEVLSALWELITSNATKDIGGGAYQLDFSKAAVARVENGWLCTVTRRMFGYSPAKRSPYDPDRPLTPIALPPLPRANRGGLDPEARVDLERWCTSDDRVREMRKQGLWTDLHDRAAAYMPFLRAQEHSAQILRPVLSHYEQRFKDGMINLLNCSTTMEMGVDIPDVGLVANSNVPPAISNYRQRLGRAGRRGEPWAFGMTFCRDLPLDGIVFNDPKRFLGADVAAPVVRLDSPVLVFRHVHAALLGAFLRGRPEGFNVQASVGAFFGATDDAGEPVSHAAEADAFIDELRGDRGGDGLKSDLTYLTAGTVLEERSASYLAASAAEAFERLLQRWRDEYRELLERRDAAVETDAKQAFGLRARRMKGEFLLGELARRGFTPSYGFPVDVVTFDHLSGHDHGEDGVTIAFGERRGGASRRLDIAVQEYAPGSEIVVDGLVHRSEGILPAWGAKADTSKLEDLQFFWECLSCLGFGLARTAPDICPECGTPTPCWKRSLRPAGFLGRRAPHTGYEYLRHVPYEMPRISASGAAWRALPDVKAGRCRADPEGQVITLGSGPHGKGYALCLDCGRAEAEGEEGAASTPLPDKIRQHRPLAAAKGALLKGGYCSGGFTRLARVQRNVRLIHVASGDVFELQLPDAAKFSEGLALAAGLREALAERLGSETREIGVSVGRSKGPGSEERVSAFLHDRASGGAGLSSRLAEGEWLGDCLRRACERLDCSEGCVHGCPACVLRADLNFGEERLDRPGGLEIAREILDRFQLPERARILGPETRVVDASLVEWLDRRRRMEDIVSVTLYLHGAPSKWELADWRVDGLFARLSAAEVEVAVVLEDATLTDKGMTLAQKLDLHRLSAYSSVALAPKSPTVNGAPILATIKTKKESIAIATSAADEAIPDRRWGLGARAALVHGSAPELPTIRNFSSEKLVELSSGNAQIIRAGARLDGRVGKFGRAFWKLLEENAPLTIAALRKHGVREAVYVDRYLLTPLTLRLLADVVRKMPGKKPVSLKISTARLSRAEREGWAVFHTFPEDVVRCNVLKELLPDACIDIRARSEIPHDRSFNIRLGDGRQATILLDQGFGMWRATGAPRHDFTAEPARQARSLKKLDFTVGVETGRKALIVLEEARDSVP